MSDNNVSYWTKSRYVARPDHKPSRVWLVGYIKSVLLHARRLQKKIMILVCLLILGLIVVGYLSSLLSSNWAKLATDRQMLKGNSPCVLRVSGPRRARDHVWRSLRSLRMIQLSLPMIQLSLPRIQLSLPMFQRSHLMIQRSLPWLSGLIRWFSCLFRWFNGLDRDRGHARSPTMTSY